MPAILPVVVRHSVGGWTAARDLCSLIDADPDTLALLVGYIPQLRFVLDDLSPEDPPRLALEIGPVAAVCEPRDAGLA